MAAIGLVEREFTDDKLKEIDKDIKNKFRWNWLERSIQISYRNSKGNLETGSFLLGDFIRKVNKSGEAMCITCDKLLSYRSKLKGSVP